METLGIDMCVICLQILPTLLSQFPSCGAASGDRAEDSTIIAHLGVPGDQTRGIRRKGKELRCVLGR